MSLSSLHDNKLYRTIKIWLVYIVLWAVVIASFIYPFIIGKDDFSTSDELDVIASGIPDFKTYTNTREKKQAFFNYLLPEVRRQNERIMQTRIWLLGIRTEILHDMALHRSDEATLNILAQQYKVDAKQWSVAAIDKLLMKVDVIPQELVLVQAANESAWGTY